MPSTQPAPGAKIKVCASGTKKNHDNTSAVIAGTHLAIRDPGRAADQVVSRIDGGSRDLELERLNAVIGDNILTSEVKRNGIGGVDPARLDRSIDQIAEDFKFLKRPSAADIFDDSFLPPLGGRLIN